MKSTIPIVLSLLAVSCTSRENNAREAVTRWVGKEITVPYRRLTVGDESVLLNRYTYSYKIVNYIDSAGCTRCRMKLDLWNAFMSQLDAADADVTLLSIIHSRDNADIRFAIRSSFFNYPVYIDSVNEFGRINNPPCDPMLHTFLLDSEDRIIAIGNPVTNPRVGDLYRSIILGGENIDESRSGDLPVKADMLSRNIGVTHPGQAVTIPYYLTNLSDEEIISDTIVTSCDCTTATLSQPVISSASIATLRVTMTPDSIIGPFQRHVQIYYKGYLTPTTVMLTGYNQ